MTSPRSKNVKFTVVPTDVEALSRENGDVLQVNDDTGMKWVLFFPSQVPQGKGTIYNDSSKLSRTKPSDFIVQQDRRFTPGPLQSEPVSS